MARGVPTTVELVEAVRDFLRAEVMPQTVGRLSFDVRVAANVLEMVERELRERDGYIAEHGRRLERLGVGSDAELAAAIRDGRFDDRVQELVHTLRESTRRRLAITNPRYLTDEDAAAGDR